MQTSNILFTTFAVCFLLTYSQGQDLARKGSLGAYLTNIPEAVTQQYQVQEGVWIQELIPNSTAEHLGLLADDVVVKVNDTQLQNVAQALPLFRALREQESIQLDILREGKHMQLSGLVKAKPMEKSPNARVRYGAVPFGEGLLRSIIHMPLEGNKFPTVIYLQGFSCGSIDQYYNAKDPIRQMVDGLVNAGFAVCRVEKPGIGDCLNTSPCSEIGYKEEVAAFDAAYKVFSKLDFVHKDQIFIYGHSLGGNTAPLLAQKYQPAGTVVYGTVLRSWFEYSLRVFRKQDIRLGADFAQIEANARRMTPLMYALFVSKQSPEEMKTDPALAKLLEEGAFGYDGSTHFFGRHYRFWQELGAENCTEAWKQIKTPVLAMYGEFDIHAIDAEDSQYIADIVNHYHPGNGTFALVPKTEHGYSKIPSMRKYQEIRLSNSFTSYREDNFNTEVVETAVNWMRKVING